MGVKKVWIMVLLITKIIKIIVKKIFNKKALFFIVKEDKIGKIFCIKLWKQGPAVRFLKTVIFNKI